jgi:hypothetical protein
MLARVLAVVVGLWLFGESQAFTLSDMAARQRATTMEMSSQDSNESRRGFLSQVATGAVILGSGVLAPSGAQALSGVGKVDEKLRGYGLPPLGPVPSGFSPLLEIYGKGKNPNRPFPILVSFSHPITYVLCLDRPFLSDISLTNVVD